VTASCHRWVTIAVLAGWICITPFTAGAEEPGAVKKYYHIADGNVDRSTYLGWRVFHTTCYGCHGVDALGTDVAPNLVERVKTLAPREFAIKVLTRYRIAVPAGEAASEEGVRAAIVEEVMKQQRGERGQVLMPAWEANTKVKPHVIDLYAYLQARADGALGPGRPSRSGQKKK
jgi:mono/diheme cytochrome c family protein